MTTRFRILTLSALVPLVYVLAHVLHISDFYSDNKLIIIPAVLGLIELLGVYWVVDFKLKGERFLNVLGFPAVSLAIIVAFIDTIVVTGTHQLDVIATLTSSAVILFTLTYILTANINILNLSSISPVPLGQAGRAAHYVLTLVFSYFFFVLLISLDASILVKLPLQAIFVFIYTFIALWTIDLAYSQRIISAISISLVISFVFVVLSMWPLEPFYFSLFMVLIYYMCLGVALEIREIVSKLLWWEYTAIFVVIFVLLLLTAPWGVNGTII